MKNESTIKEANRYLKNARATLRMAPVEEDTYLDIKPVREAFGTAYLAVLESINAVLIEKGLTKKDLPKSINGYRAALKKHLAVHDGKVLREFEKLYDALHIAGYYRALIYDTKMVRDALEAAEKFIGKLSKTIASH